MPFLSHWKHQFIEEVPLHDRKVTIYSYSGICADMVHRAVLLWRWSTPTIDRRSTALSGHEKRFSDVDCSWKWYGALMISWKRCAMTQHFCHRQLIEGFVSWPFNLKKGRFWLASTITWFEPTRIFFLVLYETQMLCQQAKAVRCTQGQLGCWPKRRKTPKNGHVALSEL